MFHLDEQVTKSRVISILLEFRYVFSMHNDHSLTIFGSHLKMSWCAKVTLCCKVTISSCRQIWYWSWRFYSNRNILFQRRGNNNFLGLDMKRNWWHGMVIDLQYPNNSAIRNKTQRCKTMIMSYLPHDYTRVSRLCCLLKCGWMPGSGFVLRTVGYANDHYLEASNMINLAIQSKAPITATTVTSRCSTYISDEPFLVHLCCYITHKRQQSVPARKVPAGYMGLFIE